MQGGGERIARDMNRHSAVVLQGPGMLNAMQNGSKQAPAVNGSMQPPESSQWQQRGRSGLEDLRESRADETEGLHIQDPRRYFERTPAVRLFCSWQ